MRRCLFVIQNESDDRQLNSRWTCVVDFDRCVEWPAEQKLSLQLLWSVFFFIQLKNWLSLPKWVKMNRLASILMLLLINMKYVYFSCTHFTCKKTIILFIYSNSISCLPTVSLLAEFFSTRAQVLVAPYFVALFLLLFSRLYCICSFLLLYLFEIVWLTAIWNSSMLYGFAVDAFISSDWVLCLCLWSEASERSKNVNKTNNEKKNCSVFAYLKKTLARLNPLETWLQWIVAKTRLFVCYTRASKLIAKNSERAEKKTIRMQQHIKWIKSSLNRMQNLV